MRRNGSHKGPTPVALVILDGYGYRESHNYNAIAHAHTPFMTACWQQYPHALLRASGTAVGLPAGYAGNSEVGHLTIGAGAVIEQPLTVFLAAINDRSFFANQVLLGALQAVKQSRGRIHIMGLLSDGGVHSMTACIDACVEVAAGHTDCDVYVHAFLDGRDVPPQSAAEYLATFEHWSAQFPHVFLGSLHGRFYAMDRDQHWDRTQKTYAVLTHSNSEVAVTWQDVLAQSYAHGITDEYVEPVRLHKDAYVRDGDGVIFCNVRPDRARQLTAVFIDPCFSHFERSCIDLACFVTPVAYADNLATQVLFPSPPITDTLKNRLSQGGKRIFAIAETEKYAHVTYFFNGMREEPVPGEKRVLVPSLLAKNYVHYPCMSAAHITAAVRHSLVTDPYDFYLINYANADMVGHAGDFNATVKAIECLDVQLQQLYDTLVEHLGGTLIITADHGKAEDMFDTVYNQPRTAHTTNPVPFIVIAKNLSPCVLPLHELKDIKGYVESVMGL